MEDKDKDNNKSISEVRLESKREIRRRLLKMGLYTAPTILLLSMTGKRAYASSRSSGGRKGGDDGGRRGRHGGDKPWWWLWW